MKNINYKSLKFFFYKKNNIIKTIFLKSFDSEEKKFKKFHILLN